MDIPTEYIVNTVGFIITATFCVIGFFIKRLINRTDAMLVDFQQHKEKDLESFATKEDTKLMYKDFKDFLDNIMEPVNRKLESIEQHLRKQ